MRIPTLRNFDRTHPDYRNAKGTVETVAGHIETSLAGLCLGDFLPGKK